MLEPFATGVTTAVSSIAGELTDFKHIVIHGTRNWTESTEKVKRRFPAGVSFIEWKNVAREINAIKDWKAFWELVSILKSYTPRYLKNKTPVAVHLHSSKAGFLGRLACRLLGIKAVIYTPHCGAFLRTDIGFLKRKLYRFLEKLGACFGGRVVGCGPSEGDLYKKLGKNTCYVSNGVALREIKKDAGKRNLISFTGLASFQKDPAFWGELADACAGFAGEYGFSFCWIGDGPEAAVLKGKSLVLTGWKSAEEVEDLLGKTAVFLSTAAWEGLPYGVLEAMSAGCALLLRDVPGNRDLVVPGGNGWLFGTREEAMEHLRQMLKNSSLLEDMGKQSRNIVERGFTLKQMGDGYRRIYSGFGKEVTCD